MRRLAGGAFRALAATWTLDALLPDGTRIPAAAYPFARQIFAVCERDAIALSALMAGRGFTVLAAHGRDGDLAAMLLEGIGCRVVRGAARRGGARALRRLVAALAVSDRPAGIVVDGPLGPPEVPKPGVLFCARETGRPVVPLGVAARRKVVFARSWSGIYLPLPGARIVIACGESLDVPAGTPRAGMDRRTAELALRLTGARAAAIRELAAARTRAPGAPAREERA